MAESPRDCGILPDRTFLLLLYLPCVQGAAPRRPGSTGVGHQRGEDTGKSKLLPASVGATSLCRLSLRCDTQNSSPTVLHPPSSPSFCGCHGLSLILAVSGLWGAAHGSCPMALPHGVAPLGDQGDGWAAGPLGVCPRGSLSLGTTTRELGSTVGASPPSSPSCALSGGCGSPETPPTPHPELGLLRA